MTLREEVIRRFFKLADVCPADDVMTFRWSPLSDHVVIQAWADEVIRQMEWARHCCAGAQFPGGPPDVELRIAPPDWEP